MKENLKMMKTTLLSSIFQRTTNNSWLEINSSSHGKTGEEPLFVGPKTASKTDPGSC